MIAFLLDFLLALAVLMLACAILFYAAVSYRWGVPRYRGPRTDHFNGRRFRNLQPTPVRGLARFLTMRLLARLRRKKGEPSSWPAWIASTPGRQPPERVPGLRVTWVNHATFLVQIEGVNCLFDPIWSERASPVAWAGPRRHRAPGLRLEDLPPIDIVLLSHNHYDHMDVPTLKAIEKAHRPQVVALLGNNLFLHQEAIDSIALDWWAGVPLHQGLRVTAVPAQHFSSRSLNDRNAALWGGFVLQGHERSVYFAGDTGYGGHFKEIGRRFPGLDVALLPIGAYKPEWFMQPVHVSPGEAVQAQGDLGARAAIPMHYGTFQLSEERFEDPLKDLQAALQTLGPQAPRFVVLKEGEGRDF